MKKILCIIIFVCSAFSVSATENLVKNADFDNSLEFWDSYSYENGAEIYTENGELVLYAPQDNHLNITQKIKVKPGAKYRFSAHVRTEEIKEYGCGAVLGFDYKTSYSESVFGNDEKNIELYFTTKEEEVPIMISLGGYSALSTGKAVFDNIVVEETDAVPENAKYYEYINGQTETKSENNTFDFRWLLLAVLLAAATLGGVYTVYSEK